MKTKLWTRNFSLAFAGMIISAIGGVGLNFAMGIVVFKETDSTILSAVFTTLSIIPNFVLPLVMGPVIDRKNPLKVLVTNEVILAFIFFGAAFAAWKAGFNFIMYAAFSVLISSFEVVSMLASSSVMPQIMPVEHYAKGNAAMNVIYPLCSVLVTPLAMLLFERFGFPLILAAYGVTSLIDAGLESRIHAKFEYIEKKSEGIRDYIRDLKDGVKYLKKDRAVLAVFLCFTLAELSYSSSQVLLYPFFERSAALTDAQYALLASIRSAGYVAGGFLHYFVKIPDRRRYSIAVGVYFIFILFDATVFFMPYWLMCASRFMLGVLGMNSANIRVSSIQARVPSAYRAKLNAFFAMLVTAAGMLGTPIAGALGEFLPYGVVQLVFQAFYLIGVIAFILPPKNDVKRLYNCSISDSVEARDTAAAQAAAQQTAETRVLCDTDIV
jgi:MFS family permease